MAERSTAVRSEVERGEVGIGSPFYRREKLPTELLTLFDAPDLLGVQRICAGSD
jgi:hypothetical protein